MKEPKIDSLFSVENNIEATSALRENIIQPILELHAQFMAAEASQLDGLRSVFNIPESVTRVAKIPARVRMHEWLDADDPNMLKLDELMVDQQNALEDKLCHLMREAGQFGQDLFDFHYRHKEKEAPTIVWAPYSGSEMEIAAMASTNRDSEFQLQIITSTQVTTDSQLISETDAAKQIEKKTDRALFEHIPKVMKDLQNANAHILEGYDSTIEAAVLAFMTIDSMKAAAERLEAFCQERDKLCGVVPVRNAPLAVDKLDRKPMGSTSADGAIRRQRVQ